MKNGNGDKLRIVVGSHFAGAGSLQVKDDTREIGRILCYGFNATRENWPAFGARLAGILNESDSVLELPAKRWASDGAGAGDGR